MSNVKPPYLDLFMNLRQAGMALSLEQYHLLLEALSLGFGTASLEDFKQVCRLLWVKPKSRFSLETFEAEFQRYIAQRFQVERKPETMYSTASEASSTSSSVTVKPPESVAPTAEPPTATGLQIPTALRGERSLSRRGQLSFSRQGFSLNVRDFPLTERQILQSWRSLRRPIREGPATELDISATLAQINRQGQFFQPVLRPQRINRAELLLLLDHDGSMIPFHLFTRPLVEAANSGRFGNSEVYYFRNCPQDYLYLKPNQPEARRLEEIVPKLHQRRTVVFIVSDGGAARGGYNPERLALTEAFLTKLQPKVRGIVWLNPLPKQRWVNTTAAYIAQLLDNRMYELTPSGLRAAIRAMKL